MNQGNLGTSSPDVNSEKSYLGKIGFGTDMFSVATTVLYGAEAVGTFDVEPNGDRTGLVDLLASVQHRRLLALGERGLRVGRGIGGGRLGCRGGCPGGAHR